MAYAQQPRMKPFLLALLCLITLPAFADTDVGIPDRTKQIIRSTDLVEVSGTNDLGGAEDFSIHNSKAIAQFVQFLTSDRYLAVPKEPRPDFKSLSRYKIRLSSNGAVVLEFDIIADSILDLPGETSFYMESDRHSDNLMAPLMRLR